MGKARERVNPWGSREPSGSGNPSDRRNPQGGGDPSGGRGPPSNEPPGGGPPDSDDPADAAAAQLPLGSSNRFIGKEPQVFTGDQTKAEEFIVQWSLLVAVNLDSPAMRNPYHRCMLFLTYLQGPHVMEWVIAQQCWVSNEVIHN
jgi:hypothetical protein